MSFKVPCYASPCLSITTFHVQDYFEEESQSQKTLSASSRFTLPSDSERTSGRGVAHVDFSLSCSVL